MSTVYDAGVLVAAERDDRDIWADHRARLETGLLPVTTAPVVAQVSRSAKQVQLRRFLRGCDIRPFTADDAHPVGSLLGKSRTRDVVDAHLALQAADDSTVLTSDPDDLRRLTGRLGRRITIRRV